MNTQGWVLERFELDGTTNQAIGSTLKPMTIAPIKTWTKDEWQSRLVARDSFAYIAAECLLGESQIPAAGIVRQMATHHTRRRTRQNMVGGVWQFRIKCSFLKWLSFFPFIF